MFIIDNILSWFISRILDNFFPRKEENMKIIQLYEERLRQKDNKIERLRKQTNAKINEKTRLLSSLKRRGISTEKLIEKYDKPLYAIFLSYSNQKVQANKKRSKGTYFTTEAFIRPEIEKLNGKYLGGTDVIIPPANVPSFIKNNEDLKNWFEKTILRGRYCKVKLLALIDIGKKTYWYNYLPYEQKSPNHYTIGEKLDVQDLFKDDAINKLALSAVIKDGDIAWLASSVLTEKEIDIIHRNQRIIESRLGNPNLRGFAEITTVQQISEVLTDYKIQDSKSVASAIKDEAKFWNKKL